MAPSYENPFLVVGGEPSSRPQPSGELTMTNSKADREALWPLDFADESSVVASVMVEASREIRSMDHA